VDESLGYDNFHGIGRLGLYPAPDASAKQSSDGGKYAGYPPLAAFDLSKPLFVLVGAHDLAVDGVSDPAHVGLDAGD